MSHPFAWWRSHAPAIVPGSANFCGNRSHLRAHRAGHFHGPAVSKIGLLSIGTDPVKPNPVWVRFLKQLGELGYVEGQNVAFERRFAGGRQERLAELVADLAERRVDVVVATSEVESIAAKRGLPTTPIVMIVVQDPVEAGLVASLGAPGRHRDGAHDPGAGAVP